jgi:hypothetical protein
MIGRTLEVLVDGYDEEFCQYFGRTYADSPEIDGRVWIASEEDLSEDYIIPAAFDPRVKDAVAAAVKQAAYDSGVARI